MLMPEALFQRHHSGRVTLNPLFLRNVMTKRRRERSIQWDMESSISDDARLQLDRFCRQYLQVQRDLEYPFSDYLRRYGFQQIIYNKLFAENAIKHAPPARHRLRVLKELLGRVETSIVDFDEEDISDDLMSCLPALLASNIPSEAVAAQQKAYVTYTIASLPTMNDCLPTITLLEARNLLVAARTTGLRTWEAALHLGNYLCENPHLVHGKTVLELGAGTGYTSVLCAKYLGATHVTSTDGSEEVVGELPTNFYLNGLQYSSLIEAKELKWGQVLMGGEQPEWNGGRNVDLVLGADISYDPIATRALVATFGDLFELFPHVNIIIAATVRNEKTYQAFLDTCKTNKFSVDEIEYEIQRPELQKGPFYTDAIPLQLLRIKKS